MLKLIPYSRRSLPLLLSVTCFCCLALAAPSALAEGEVNPINVQMDRFHNEEFQPGQEFEVQVRIVADGGGQLTAMGLRETIPPNWTFMGMQGVTGDVPAVSPSPGDQGLLEFAWISVPQLPYTFSYTLQVPEENGEATQVFHGALEYRLDAGANYAPPVVTSVNGAPDTQPPVITLTGGASISIELNGAWSEPGYSARDNVDGNVTSSVTVSGDVNTSVAGSYSLNYSVSDRAGNRGTAERVVTVSGTTDGGTGGGTGGGGTAGPITSPRPGTGVGNGTGTSRQMNNAAGPARKTDVAKAAKEATAAKLAAQEKAKADSGLKGGSLEMRPGVAGAQDPAANADTSGTPEAVASANGAPGVRGEPSAGGDRTTDATQAGADDGERKLSNAWPELEAAEAAKLAGLDPDTGTPLDGSAGLGPRSSSASLLVVAMVLAVILLGVGGSLLGARGVYGGRRRRVAPPRES